MQLFRAREYIQKNRRVLKKLGNSTEEVFPPWRHNTEVQRAESVTGGHTLFISCVKAWTEYMFRLPFSIIDAMYRPCGLITDELIPSSTLPISKRSLQVCMLTNLIIPSWLSTPRTWVDRNDDTVTFESPMPEETSYVCTFICVSCKHILKVTYSFYTVSKRAVQLLVSHYAFWIH